MLVHRWCGWGDGGWEEGVGGCRWVGSHPPPPPPTPTPPKKVACSYAHWVWWTKHRDASSYLHLCSGATPTYLHVHNGDPAIRIHAPGLRTWCDWVEHHDDWSNLHVNSRAAHNGVLLGQTPCLHPATCITQRSCTQWGVVGPNTMPASSYLHYTAELHTMGCRWAQHWTPGGIYTALTFW